MRGIFAVGVLLATTMPGLAADVGQLKGGWVSSDSSCAAYRDRLDESAMTISSDRIEFYESACVVRSAKKAGATYSLKLLCEGEGETFQRGFVGTLKGRDILVVKDGFTYRRCS